MFPQSPGPAFDANVHLYSNIPNSGFDEKNPYNASPDEDWKKNGYLGRFDQSLYTDGVNPRDIGLRDWGFYYYPAACVQGGCNLQVLYHGCFEMAETAIDYFTAYAA